MAVAALPVSVLQVAKTQVCDARTARLAQPGKGRQIRALTKKRVKHLAPSLHRCPMVGCAQKDDFAQPRKPWALLLCGDMARTARNQPTHAVPHDDQFLQRNGPNGNQLVQRGAKAPSVF